jgi:hypothetical protein
MRRQLGEAEKQFGERFEEVERHLDRFADQLRGELGERLERLAEEHERLRQADDDDDDENGDEDDDDE